MLNSLKRSLEIKLTQSLGQNNPALRFAIDGLKDTFHDLEEVTEPSRIVKLVSLFGGSGLEWIDMIKDYDPLRYSIELEIKGDKYLVSLKDPIIHFWDIFKALVREVHGSNLTGLSEEGLLNMLVSRAYWIMTIRNLGFTYSDFNYVCQELFGDQVDYKILFANWKQGTKININTQLINFDIKINFLTWR